MLANSGVLGHRQQAVSTRSPHSSNTGAGTTTVPHLPVLQQQQHTSSCRGTRLSTSASVRLAQQGTQRLFLDSADIRQWEKWAPTGTLHGFTTNPLILDRDGVPCTLGACKQLLHTVGAGCTAGSAALLCQAVRSA